MMKGVEITCIERIGGLGVGWAWVAQLPCNSQSFPAAAVGSVSNGVRFISDHRSGVGSELVFASVRIHGYRIKASPSSDPGIE